MRAITTLTIVCSTMLVGACASLDSQVQGSHRDYTELASAHRVTMGSWTTPRTESGAALTLDQMISSPTLQQLISQALDANPSLQQTLTTLKIYRAQARQTAGNAKPSVEAGLSGEKGEHSDTSYSGTVSVQWQLDLWRSLSDRSAAVQKDVEQQQLLYQAARDSLAAQVMDAWISLIAQQRSIAIQQSRIDSLARTEGFIVQRYRSGVGEIDDLENARSNLSSAKATLEALQESLLQQHRDLANLLGQSATRDIAIAAEFPSVELAIARTPNQTLANRPDLQGAYAAIEAAGLRSQAAYKDLLPSFSLQAALTDVASSPRQALLTDPVWSLLGQLTAPLYQGGKLRANAEAAQLEAALAYYSYKETLLTAITEVENALSAERSLNLQQQHTQAALDSAQSSLEQYRSSYRSGLASIIDLLTIEQQTYDLASQLNDLTYQRLANRINLGLSLGLRSSQ